jgi:hypothetical protein
MLRYADKPSQAIMDQHTQHMLATQAYFKQRHQEESDDFDNYVDTNISSIFYYPDKASYNRISNRVKFLKYSPLIFEQPFANIPSLYSSN